MSNKPKPLSHSPSPALFFETASAFERTEALRTAVELDLFSLISAGHQTAEEIAARCNTSPRGTRILANYLVSLGFLLKTGDQYQLTHDSAVYLDRKSPNYLGEAMDYLVSTQIRSCFGSLTDAVRNGGTALANEGVMSTENTVWVSYARSIGPVMELPARLLARQLGGDRKQALRVLDVAARARTSSSAGLDATF